MKDCVGDAPRAVDAHRAGTDG